jgi:hypothetical protein
MGCGRSSQRIETFAPSGEDVISLPPVSHSENPPSISLREANSAIVIQSWVRKHQAEMKFKQECSWRIFQEMEYLQESAQMNLHTFFARFDYKMSRSAHACRFGQNIAHLEDRFKTSSRRASNSSIKKNIQKKVEHPPSVFPNVIDIELTMELLHGLLQRVVDHEVLEPTTVMSILKQVIPSLNIHADAPTVSHNYGSTTQHPRCFSTAFEENHCRW